MGENTHACCCDHSEEALLKRIGELAAEYKGREGSLIQVLHMAQGIYGYLPLEYLSAWHFLHIWKDSIPVTGYFGRRRMSILTWCPGNIFLIRYIRYNGHNVHVSVWHILVPNYSPGRKKRLKQDRVFPDPPQCNRSDSGATRYSNWKRPENLLFFLSEPSL